MAVKRFHRRRRRHMKGRGLAAKVRRIGKVVNRTKAPRKIYDSSTVAYASYSGNQDISTATACIQSFKPVTGTGFPNRQNPYVHLQSVEMHCRFDTTKTQEVVRLQGFVMQDQFESGTTYNNLFNPSSNTAFAPIGQIQPANLCTQRYRMIYDSGPRIMGTTGGNHNVLVLRKRINLKGLKVEFAGATTTDPYQNGIYWVALSSEAPGAGPTYITNTICSINWQHCFNG